jgi:NADPH:quinone reductase-like Zn-dependent oxidoreductase
VTLREFSGTVSKLGPGVSSVAVGDGVYGITNVGAAAEYTVAPVSAIGPRPQTLSPTEAAIVPLAGMTAWQALFDHGNVQPGQRVLIHAAAGGVGSYAVQLAKWRGAYVIGTASASRHEGLRNLGADELIDYRAQRFQDVVHDVDMVLHSIGQDQVPASLQVLKPGGILVAISADPMEEEAKRQGKRSMVFMMQPNSDQLRKIAELIDNGTVKPVIEEIVPLDQAAEAMNELQGGHVFGKIGVSLM